MSRKDFIALADTIRFANMTSQPPVFGGAAINDLADFCRSRNPRFNRSRWIGYITGENTAHGKAIKTTAKS